MLTEGRHSVRADESRVAVLVAGAGTGASDLDDALEWSPSAGSVQSLPVSRHAMYITHLTMWLTGTRATWTERQRSSSQVNQEQGHSRRLGADDTVQSRSTFGDGWHVQHLARLLDRGSLHRIAVPSAASEFGLRLLPGLINVSCSEQVVVDGENRCDPRRARLFARLLTALEAEPVEDGVDHPAEQVIGDTLEHERPELALDWLREIALDGTHPALAASVLRCLGRVSGAGSPSWRADVVRSALAQDSTQVRDAAVQAAELWADREVVEVLRGHREPCPWLQQYVRDVIDDLSE